MSFLLPEIEKTDVQTTLNGKASGELARTITAYTQRREAPAAMESNFDNTDGPIPNTKAWPHPLLPTAAGAARLSGSGRHRPVVPASESRVRATGAAGRRWATARLFARGAPALCFNLKSVLQRTRATLALKAGVSGRRARFFIFAPDGGGSQQLSHDALITSIWSPEPSRCPRDY
jgi:hypothetical protein